MENLSFDTKANTEVTLDLSQTQQSINRALKEYSDFINTILSKEFNKVYNRIFDNLSVTLKRTLEEFSCELNMKVLFPPETIKNIQDSINDSFKSLNVSESEKEVIIDFSDQQLETLEQSNIPINDYVIQEKSTKNKKLFTTKIFLGLITLITAIIQLFTACEEHETAKIEHGTAIINRDNVKSQNKSQDDQIEKLSEITKMLIESYNAATSK
mgnify:FL=1|jgi:hypothetical protein|nr:MAG TPA: hypothetical protein [Caudoviricetes sp.]